MTETTHPLHDQSIGEIATRLPGASGIFRRFGIDFCCQGHVLLKNAVNHRRASLEELEAALNALDPSAPQPVPQDTEALIDHIRTCYHQMHRQQLPELIALSRKVEAVHVNHPDVPAGLAEFLHYVWHELEAHMKKEEQAVFPVMRRQKNGSISEPIREMRYDHNDYAAFLDQIGRLTDDYTLPEDACRSWRTLYDGVARFRVNLIEHVHLENNVLFPRFESAA